jgi:hypothetical protein
VCPNVTAQPFCNGDQVFELLIVLIVGKASLFESVHLGFSIEQAVGRFLASLALNHAALDEL